MGRKFRIKTDLVASVCDKIAPKRSLVSDEKSIRQKYYHLLHAVSKLALIKLPNDLEGTMYTDNSVGV